MRKILSVFVLLLSFKTLVAQKIPDTPSENEEPVYFEKPKPLWKEKLHYGGNIMAGFFGSFYLNASPMAGYEITDAGGTIAGIGANFIYQGGYQQGGAFAAGPRFFIRQAVWRSIFVHGEYELMNAPETQFYSWNRFQTTPPTEIKRIWGGSPLIGAGFYQGRTRQQGGSFISVMYNMGQSYNKGFISPQGLGGNYSPWVLRFGFFI